MARHVDIDRLSDQLKSIMLLPVLAVDLSSGTMRSSSTSVKLPLSNCSSTRSRTGRAASLMRAQQGCVGRRVDVVRHSKTLLPRLKIALRRPESRVDAQVPTSRRPGFLVGRRHRGGCEVQSQ